MGIEKTVFQVSRHTGGRRTSLRRSLPVGSDRISQRHRHQPSLLQRLYAFRSNRNLRLLLIHLHNSNDGHQDLCGRLHGRRPTIHTTGREPSGAILPQRRYPFISGPLNMELHLLSHSRSPSLGPNARLMGRTTSQRHPPSILLLLRHLSPRHLHHPLTTLHYPHHRRLHRVDPVQSRQKDDLRRDGPVVRVHPPARWLGYGERGPALCGCLSG